MTTLLNVLESPENAASSFGDELRTTMAAARLTIRWFGVRRSVSCSQKRKAAETFDAESNFVSMGKKLFDTTHPAWKHLTAVRGKVVSVWKDASLPFPETGIRLIKRSDVDSFNTTMDDLRTELSEAECELDNHYDELQTAARRRLGSLYNPEDYPASMRGMFDIMVDYPNVEPPSYLRTLSPSLYHQESERVRTRFTEAVKLAEDVFIDELTKLVEHLSERISGSDDGKPKIFRDTVITNLIEFFERFQRLNIGSSEELDRLVADVQQITEGIAPSDLRNSATLRQRVSGELSRVQASIDGLIVDRPRRNLIRRNGGSNADHH